MSRDIYASLSGAVGAWRHLEVVANNLANTNTNGFKATKVAFGVVGPDTHLLGKSYAAMQPPAQDQRDGAVVTDGVATHVALQGDGYFAVGQGDAMRLTRDGRFAVSTDGVLVDPMGQPVLGQNGPISVQSAFNLRIDADGKVYNGEGEASDQLRIVSGDVQGVGNNQFTATGVLSPSTARVVQGALEASNVNPLEAMVELVTVSRYFEAYQKAMQASDELDGRLNQLGGQ